MQSIILCGGSGTRLWPLSRKNFPKQFLKLYSDNSLLQETYLRMREIMPKENIIFVTNKENFFNVFNQVKELDPDFNKEQILMEPQSLNTAPAIALAVKYLAKKNISPEEPIIEVHSDHFIKDKKTYLELVQTAMSELGDKIGTIGIVPTFAETGFGYIHKGQKNQNHFQVLEFKEKPDKETAEKYVASGEYLWNAGMYLFTRATFERELEKHAPEIFEKYSQVYEKLIENFASLPDIAFDNAISEKSQDIVVFEGDFGWSDIGSFESLAEIEEKNGKEKSKYIGIDSKNVYAKSFSDRLIATVGVEDLVIVDNVDCILVHKKGRGQDVKKVVEKLKEKNLKELEHNVIVHRPWGKFEILIEGDNHQVKRITVYPGEKLSLQAHNHRAEHWIVVKGSAKVLNGEKEMIIRENESTFIPAGTKHRLENPGKISLEIIEVQTGNYLGEDDIIRFDDIYNRIEK